MSVSRGNTLILVENLSVPFDRRVWQECCALTEAGWRVTVVSPCGQSQDTAEYEQIDGVEFHRFRLEAATAGFYNYGREYTAALWKMGRIIRRLTAIQKFDVVHACNPPDILFLPALLARLKGAAFVFDQHDLVPELYLSRFKRCRDLAYLSCLASEYCTFCLADVVISPNESYRRVALDRGHCDPRDVFVVRSAPDGRSFAAVAPDHTLKRGKEHLLVYLGVMGPQDGVDLALHALNELRGIRSDWHAVFIGSGDMLPAMVKLTADLKLDACVEFTGRVSNEELLTRLSTADIGLAPDPRSPLNEVSTMNKIGEYMALGVPVVSFDLVETRVTAQRAALYATPNDPRSFAKAIATLLGDSALRGAMGEFGRDRMAHDLSWDVSAEALAAAYDHALRRRGSSRAAWRPLAVWTDG
jgi:glycosyltransferase involved in cell wall biosynthesis